MIDPAWVSVLSAILFTIGLWGAFTRKNAIVVLMCLELILNAANLQFVAAAIQHGDASGWVYAIFAIAIAASEVAIGQHSLSMQFSSFSCRCLHSQSFSSLDTSSMETKRGLSRQRKEGSSHFQLWSQVLFSPCSSFPNS